MGPVLNFKVAKIDKLVQREVFGAEVVGSDGLPLAVEAEPGRLRQRSDEQRDGEHFEESAAVIATMAERSGGTPPRLRRHFHSSDVRDEWHGGACFSCVLFVFMHAGVLAEIRFALPTRRKRF